jgi:phosphate transport system protein
LERIGDYAKGISKINLMIGEEPLIKPLVDLPWMAEKARDMLHRALEAFVKRDVDLACAIPAEDDEVDALYNQVYRELLTLIMADPRTIDQATYLLWAAHNLERAADRVINICERVVFTVTGKLMEMDVEEGAASCLESLG